MRKIEKDVYNDDILYIDFKSAKRNLQEKLKLQELVSDVSHKIKTPLTNLKMISTTVAKDDIPT